MIVPIPIVGPSFHGRSTVVNTQETINLMLNVDNSGAKSVLSLMNRPCLEDFCDLGAQAIRGMVEEGVYGYVVSGAKFYKISNDGTYVEKGTLLSNAGPVGMASNGFDIFITDGNNGYNYRIATDTFTNAPGDFLGGDCVTFIDQYFVTNKPDTGIAQSSGLADGTSWNAVDIATAEGDPDSLVRPIALHGMLWLMGEKTSEPYYNMAYPAGFPFGRSGSGTVEMGLAARWSAVSLADSVYWLAKNREGFAGVCRAAGTGPEKISTPAIDYQIGKLSIISDAIAFGFADEGHAFYVLIFPTGNKTFVFDVYVAALMGINYAWTEWQSRDSVGVVGVFKCHHHMMITTNHIVGDSTTGKLYKLKHGIYSDAGDIVEKIRTTQHLNQSGKRITINSLWVDFEPGVGIQGNATSSIKSPDTAVDDATVGTIVWGNVDSVKSSDLSYAVCSNVIASCIDYEVKIVKSDGTIGTTNKKNAANWSVTPGGYTSYGSENDLWGESWTFLDINNSNFGVVVSAQGDFAISHYLKATNFKFNIPSNTIIRGILVEVQRYANLGAMDSRINHIRITVYYDFITPGEDPLCMFQFSKDGGNTWSNEYARKIGKIGEYGRRAKFRIGSSAYNWTFKIKVSDPVKTVITGAFADVGIY